MELELKHLASYLPYQLQIQWTQPEEHKNSFLKMTDPDCIKTMSVVTMMAMAQGNKNYKPILRPLDLTKEIEVNGEKFIPRNELIKLIDEFGNANPTIVFIWSFSGWYFEWYAGTQLSIRRSVPYSFYQKLVEWHLDIFGLIQLGLAIDINTLEKQS